MRIYLVGEFMADYPFSGSVDDATAAFATYEEAFDFLKDYCDPEEKGSWRYQIKSLVLGDREPWDRSQVWVFDRALSLLRHFGAETDSVQAEWQGPAEEAHLAAYNVGDIVMAREVPRSENTDGCLDVIAVVQQLPHMMVYYSNCCCDYLVPDPLPEGAELYWHRPYEVQYISECGHLWGMEAYEEDLVPFTGPLPERLAFLQTLSDFYKGHINIRAEAYEAICARKMRVDKVRQFSPDDIGPRWP